MLTISNMKSQRGIFSSLFDGWSFGDERKLIRDPHREYARKQHRIIGHYLAIQSWIRNLDCIVLTRSDLEGFLGLERLKSARVEWLKEDLSPWFKFQQPYFNSSSPTSINSLFLSRVAFDGYLPEGSMTTDERITGIASNGPATAKFIPEDSHWLPPTEPDMIGQLAIISSGLSVPQDFPAKRKVRTQ